MGVKINPMSDRVVAQALEAATKTSSGILLPGSAQEKPKLAKVLAVGPEVKAIKVGDTILYEDYANTDVRVDGEDFIVVKEEKILATVK